jgi:carbon monoxide dehydrogenase subunit G
MNKLILVVLLLILCVIPTNLISTKDIYVESVSNKIQIGNLAGNRNLEFGIRNILEEFLQKKDYDLNPESKSKVSVEIVYLDVLKTKSNISVFHKDEESVVIRLKGILKIDGKKIKEITVEEESSEVSMSTVAIDNGGQFNQQSLSNAIKKACEKLVNKLFDSKQ